MARIFIAIGAADHKPGSELFPVYIGRDGDAYRKAIAASKYPSLTLFQNPIGIRKTNGKAIENAAAQASDENSVIEVTPEQLAEYTTEMKRVQDLAANRGLEVETLKARITELEALRAPVPAEISPTKEETSPSPSPESAAEPASSPEGEAPAANATRRGSRR